MTALVDPQEMVRPLLEAQPGTKAVTACRRCSATIDGLAALDERGFFTHPGDCPPTEKRQETPQYRLL